MNTTAIRNEWRPSDGLYEAVWGAYGLRIRARSTLLGGEECEVAHIDCAEGRWVLKIGPAWRSTAELEWSYAIAAQAAIAMQEVSAPCTVRDGGFVIRYCGRPLSIWPFIEGCNLKCSDPHELDLAASTLARLQRELANIPHPGPRPQTPATSPLMQLAPVDSPIVVDHELDQWLTEWRRISSAAQTPIHGDYWPNNLIRRGMKIVGIIDWDDARIGSIDSELSFAVWDFCMDPLKATLDLARASRFLDVYTNSDGPLLTDDRAFVVPLIREHLRHRIRRALGAAESGLPFNRAVLEADSRAFLNLRQSSIQ